MNRGRGIGRSILAVVAAACALGASVSDAKAQLIAYEGFDYSPPGQPLDSYPGGGTGWIGNWTRDIGTWTVAAPSMTYTASDGTLVVSGGRVTSSLAQSRRSYNLPGGRLGNTPGTLWVSMLAQQTAGNTSNNFGGFRLPTGPGTFLYFGKPFNSPTWGIDGGPGTSIRNSTVPTSQAAFLVLRIDFRAGADDVYMWVNPPLASEPSIATAAIAAPAYNNFQDIELAFLETGSNNSPITFDADEIRLGRRYVDVAPRPSIPPNDACANAIPVGEGTYPYSTVGATTDGSSPCGDLSNDIWFRYTAGCTGTATVTTCSPNRNYDTVIAIRDGCGGPALACNDDGGGCGTGSTVTFPVVAGAQYLIQVGGFNRAQGSSELTISCRGDSPLCCDGRDWHQDSRRGPEQSFAHTLTDFSSGLVLFGGQSLTGFFPHGETWQLDAARTWTRRATTGPAPRFTHAAAYDSVRGVLVLFGGQFNPFDPSSLLGDTWELRAPPALPAWTWVQRTPGQSPNARAGMSMAFDEARGRVVLFGGYDGSFLNDTWEWDGTTWALVPSTTLPSPRRGSSMVWNPDSQRLMLFGGETAVGTYVSDLWERVGTQWTLRASSGSGPAPRTDASVAFARDCNTLVVFGGRGSSVPFSTFGDTWTWSGSWTQGASAGLVGRLGASGAYDAGTRKVVVFSGANTDLSFANAETWGWYIDCNQNHAADAIDIQTGFSQDCNMNCVPDECECGTLSFHGVWDGPEQPPILLWTRELSLKRYRSGRVGDAFGQGEMALASRVFPEDQNTGGVNPDRVESYTIPLDGGPWSQDRAKKSCSSTDCGGDGDNASACNWTWFKGSNKTQSDAILFGNLTVDHSVGMVPDFCQPVRIELAFGDEETFWDIFIGILFALVAALFSALSVTFPPLALLASFFGFLTALQFEGNGGTGSAVSTSPAPVGNQTQVSSCQSIDLDSTRGKAEVEWIVTGGSGGSSSNLPCFSFGPGPESPNTLAYFAFGYLSGSELRFYTRVQDRSLRDPSFIATRRVIHYFMDLDNDRNTGSSRPFECGADCQVTIVEVPSGAGVLLDAQIFCWRCPCPGQPPDWILENGRPYDITVNFKEAAVTASVHDLRNPTGAIAAWSVMENGGAYVGAMPGPDPCVTRLLIQEPLPDDKCPRIRSVQSFDPVTSVAANPIQIQFSEPMAAIAASDLVLSPSLIPLRTQLDASRRVLSIFPDNTSQSFPPGRYSITVSSSITDEAGNPLDGRGDLSCGTSHTMFFCVPNANAATTNSAGAIQRSFNPGSNVFARGTGFTPGTYRLFVVYHGLLGVPGTPYVQQAIGGSPTVVIGANGVLPITNLGTVASAGEYAIFLDNGDGLYQTSDTLFSPCDHSFVVGNACNETLDDVIAWLPFDELTETGPFAELMEGNHGRLLGGGSSTVPGVVGRALTLTGTNYVEVPNSPDLNVGTGDFSFAYWVRLSAANAPGVRTIQDYRGNVAGYHMFLNNGNPGVNLSLQSGFNNYVANRNVADGNWHHVTVAIERNSTTGLKIYVDGTLAGTFNPTARNGNLNDTAPFRIGSRSANVSGLFTGSLDEVMLFDRALLPNEAQFIYLRGPRGICLDRPQCVADFDDGSGTGTPDGGVTIDDLLFYVGQFSGGTVLADVDDGSGTNTPDGGVTIDDLLYYLQRFADGC